VLVLRPASAAREPVPSMELRPLPPSQPSQPSEPPSRRPSSSSVKVCSPPPLPPLPLPLWTTPTTTPPDSNLTVATSSTSTPSSPPQPLPVASTRLRLLGSLPPSQPSEPPSRRLFVRETSSSPPPAADLSLSTDSATTPVETDLSASTASTSALSVPPSSPSTPGSYEEYCWVLRYALAGRRVESQALVSERRTGRRGGKDDVKREDVRFEKMVLIVVVDD